MLETLKKKAKKSHIIRAVVSLVIAVALLAVTKFAVFDVITGPAKLDITADPDRYSGKYVTIDAQFFLADYVEHTTTTTRRYGGSTTSTDGYSYIAFQAVDDYEAQSSTWYFYSVYLKKADQDKMNGLMEEAWEWAAAEEANVNPPEPQRLTGTWTKMDGALKSYYEETLEELGVEESEYDKIYFYNLETDKLGGVYYLAFWVMQIAALACIIYFVYSLIAAFGDRYAAKINQYLQENPTMSIAKIESDFAQAKAIDKNTWIGRYWTIFIRGTKADIVENGKVVWAYYFRRTGRNSVSEMRLFTEDGKMTGVSLTEEETKQALQIYQAEQPQMVLGYTKELETLYKKDLRQFKAMRYDQAKEQQDTMQL